MSRNARKRPQRKMPHATQESSRGGIVAVRRPVAPESHEVLGAILGNIGSELVNKARLFEPESLGVTIIGFSRFDKRDRRSAPPTFEVCQAVSSSLLPLQCRLGELAVFGSGTKHKLGFRLVSDELVSEIAAIEAAYADRGITLRNDPNNPCGEANPHLSIALLYGEAVGHFREESVLARLRNLGLGRPAIQTEIILDPVAA